MGHMSDPTLVYNQDPSPQCYGVRTSANRFPWSVNCDLVASEQGTGSDSMLQDDPGAFGDARARRVGAKLWMRNVKNRPPASMRWLRTATARSAMTRC
jgi:hypothetical protein